MQKASHFKINNKFTNNSERTQFLNKMNIVIASLKLKHQKLNFDFGNFGCSVLGTINIIKMVINAIQSLVTSKKT